MPQGTEGAAVQGQPNGSDPKPAAGLQDGGITPTVSAALAKLPAEEAAAVRAEIAQRNAQLTQSRQELAVQRQKLAKDVELANVMRDASRDPEFMEYLDARHRGDTMTFFRRRAGVQVGLQSDQRDNQAASVAVDDTTGTERHLAPPPEALVRRIESVEEMIQRDQAAREAQRFAQANPDYEAYLPMMQQVRSRLPNASLDDIYSLAKHTVQSAVATQGAQQETAQVTEKNTSPPPPMGGQGTANGQDVQAKPKTIREAFQQAKIQRGLPADREVVFVFDKE